MMEDNRNISICALGIWCKNIERIGDRVTNIAENIRYMLIGEMLTGERPKSDNASTSKFDFDDNEYIMAGEL